MPNIKLIFAQSQNGIIGNDNTLPWHLPDELKLFKEKTIHGTVLMGRKTWESLPLNIRPLPNRANIIASKCSDFNKEIIKKYGSYHYIKNNTSEDFTKYPRVISNIEPILQNNRESENNIWVIGGKTIYEAALPFATELHITMVLKDVAGNVSAPNIDYSLFQLSDQTSILKDSVSGTLYQVSVLKRKL